MVASVRPSDQLPGGYRQWRARKLYEALNTTVQVVEIEQPDRLTHAEIQVLMRQCELRNFAVYRLKNPQSVDKSSIRALTCQVGMTELDNNLCADKNSLSSIEVRNEGLSAGYIPYTDRALSWHTDGYYNPLDRHIRSFLLHCVCPAQQGGENYLLDHEQVFIELCDHNPRCADALMHPQAMIIPANENHENIRQAQAGPVFYIDDITGYLQMRFTSRTRSIEWRDDALTREAVETLARIISPHNSNTVCHRLSEGEGIICNNVLHARAAFVNGTTSGQNRLLYRARSNQRLFMPGAV